jgi:hypothetical protein
VKNLSAARHGKNKVFVFSIILLLLTVFLLFSNDSLAEETLKMGRVQYSGGTGKTDEDFIEILNPTQKEINLKGYRLVKRAATSQVDTSIKSWTSDTFVSAGDVYLWANSKNGFAESLGADTSTTQTISEGNQIALRFGKENEGIIIDSLNWKEKEDDEKEEEKEDSEIDNSNYSGKIIINEILPSPESGEKEFIELLNLTSDKIDIKDWYVLDEKNNKKILAKEKTEVEKYFHKFDSFSLNSEGDTVFLYDKNKNLIDKIIYPKSKAGYFYAFDESVWRWTSKTTPGKKNEFDEKLSSKIKKDKKIYKNTYANFEAKDVTKYAKKFTWDFGDSHKSYLKKTRHKYEKSGKYEASLRVATEKGTKGFEEAIYYFTIEVKNYPKSDVEIISVLANPAGKDTLGEKMTVRNNSKKQVNLKGWSIATGTKNLVNHTITKDFKLKPGKSKEITRKYSLFTLGNKVSKIELRMPNGKTIQKIKYDRKDDSISDDETYEKNENGWNWIEAQNDTEEEAQKNTEEKIPPLPEGDNVSNNLEAGEDTAENSNNNDINLTQQEILSAIGKYSLNPDWQEKQKNKIVLLSAGTNVRPPKILLENQARVLGVSTKKIETQPNVGDKKFYPLIKRLWVKINSGLNWVLNRIN